MTSTLSQSHNETMYMHSRKGADLALVHIAPMAHYADHAGKCCMVPLAGLGTREPKWHTETQYHE
jgi:hypothetical protein